MFLSVFGVQSKNQIMYEIALNTFGKAATSHEVFECSTHTMGFADNSERPFGLKRILPMCLWC